MNALQLINLLTGKKVKVPETLRTHYPQLESIANQPAEPTLFPCPKERAQRAAYAFTTLPPKHERAVFSSATCAAIYHGKSPNDNEPRYEDSEDDGVSRC